MKRMPVSKVRPILAKERQYNADLYAALSGARLDLHEPLGPPERRYRLRLGGAGREQPVTFTPTSFAQLCGLAGVPLPFMEKVPPSLGLKVLRSFMEMADEAVDRTHLLRVKTDRPARLRAILPQGYVRFDDCELLSVVEAAVSGMNVTVTNLAVDEDAFFLRLVLGAPLELGTARAPDPAFSGIDVITSETGRRALEVRHVVWRVVCSNGITHIVDRAATLKTSYARMERAVFEAAFRGALEEAVGKGREVAERLAGTRGHFIEDPVAEVEELFRRHGLGSIRGKVGQWVVGELVRNHTLFGVQKWHICQAVTAVARGLEHGPRQRLEDAIGAYLLAA